MTQNVKVKNIKSDSYHTINVTQWIHGKISCSNGLILQNAHQLRVLLSFHIWALNQTYSNKRVENNLRDKICPQGAICSYSSILERVEMCYFKFSFKESTYVTWSRGMSRMSGMLFLRYWQKQCSNSFVSYIVFTSVKSFISL